MRRGHPEGRHLARRRGGASTPTRGCAGAAWTCCARRASRSRCSTTRSSRAQNEQFFHYMRTGRPFVHVKLATTLDGRIAASRRRQQVGDRRGRARRGRTSCGPRPAPCSSGPEPCAPTIPLLTPRDLPEDPPRHHPRRPRSAPHPARPTSQLARTARRDPVVVFAARSSGRAPRRGLALPGRRGRGRRRRFGGGLDLVFVLEELGRRGVRGVLVEGGGETARASSRQGPRGQAHPVLRAEADRARRGAHDRGSLQVDGDGRGPEVPRRGSREGSGRTST